MADENPYPPSGTAHPSPDRPAEETIKETIESIVIAFILAFVFRAYVVEAFVIPTGSMAPTLLGAHTPMTCDQCGYHFVSDWPPEFAVPMGDQSAPRPLRPGEKATYACPMCRAPNDLKGPAKPQSGDRILVHKYLYTVSEPQRWDVVVFKNPALPHENYIKRLVGLPNENLYLFEGNIYTQPLDDAGQPGTWSIARKPERPEVQRAVFQPVYHSQYIPLDGGNRNGTENDWSVPWTTPQPTAWSLEGVRSYEHKEAGRSAIHFDFGQAVRPIRPGQFGPGFYMYNQLHPSSSLEPIEDVRVAATVEPRADGVSVAFSTTARLPGISVDREQHRLRATLETGGRVVLEALDMTTGAATPIAEAPAPALEKDSPLSVELWYVDQQASVWIDGTRVLKHDFDLPFEQLVARPPLPQATTPNVAIEVEGPVTLHEVEVDRDLYYQDALGEGTARGAYRRGGTPLHLGADHFFCVGDNGPRSYDGRFWRREAVNRWVAAEFLADRIANGEDPAGVVPREMMMGRAFFVYFPAPFSAGMIPLPNFGDMRFIH